MVLSAADARKLTVPRLKEELSKRGLDSQGNKPDLLNRLVESIEQAAEDSILNDTGVVDLLGNDDILNDDILDAPSINGDDEDKLLNVSHDIPTSTTTGAAEAEVSENKNSVTSPTPKTGEDAKLARAARFGLPITGSVTAASLGSDSAKEARAKRFGNDAVTPSVEVVASDEAKAKRAARFGTVDPSTKEKLSARAARFGLPVTADGKTPQPTEEKNPKLLERAKRFGLIDEDADAKKKARLERFAN